MNPRLGEFGRVEIPTQEEDVTIPEEFGEVDPNSPESMDRFIGLAVVALPTSRVIAIMRHLEAQKTPQEQ